MTCSLWLPSGYPSIPGEQQLNYLLFSINRVRICKESRLSATTHTSHHLHHLRHIRHTSKPAQAA